MAISMEWVGGWLQNVPYSYNQVVRYEGIVYICVAETTVQSSTPPTLDTTNWNIFSTPGTAGTSGQTGTSGTSGEDGTSGTSGEAGESGTSGTSGYSSLIGSTEWNVESEYQIGSDEQFTFSGDYVLDESYLYIESSNTQVEYSANKFFKKRGKLFIGGNLLLRNSQIENDGEISVGGQVILMDNSQITGTGTII
jgi:hypothetical protein